MFRASFPIALQGSNTDAHSRYPGLPCSHSDRTDSYLSGEDALPTCFSLPVGWSAKSDLMAPGRPTN